MRGRDGDSQPRVVGCRILFPRNTPMLDVTFLGTLVGDQTVTPLERSAGAKRAARIATAVGGGVATASESFERASGFPATLLGITGRDPLGTMLMQLMADRVPRTVPVPTASRSRLSVILPDVDREPGTSFLYTMRSEIDGPATFAAVEPFVQRSGMLAIASLTAADADLLDRLLAAAPHGAYVLPTVSQLGDPRSMEILKRAAFMQINEHEGEAATGFQDPVEMLCQLREIGFRKTLIVTSVERGISALHKGEWFHAPSLNVEAVQEVGCGDTVAGTILAALALGHDFSEALQGAAAAAAMHAANLTREGGWDELLRFSADTRAKPTPPRFLSTWMRAVPVGLRDVAATCRDTFASASVAP